MPIYFDPQATDPAGGGTPTSIPTATAVPAPAVLPAAPPATPPAAPNAPAAVPPDAVIKLPDGRVVRAADAATLISRSLPEQDYEKWQLMNRVAEGDTEAFAKLFGKPAAPAGTPVPPAPSGFVSKAEYDAMTAKLAQLETAYGAMKPTFEKIGALEATATAKSIGGEYLKANAEHLPALTVLAKQNGDAVAVEVGRTVQSYRRAAHELVNRELTEAELREVDARALVACESQLRQTASAFGFKPPTPPAQRLRDTQPQRGGSGTVYTRQADGSLVASDGSRLVDNGQGAYVLDRIPSPSGPGMTMSPDTGIRTDGPVTREQVMQQMTARLEAMNTGA